MILTQMYVAIKTVLGQIYNEAFVKNERNAGYLKNLLTVLIIVGIAAGGFYSYKFYVHRKESTAQLVFSECLVELENAKSGSGSWEDVLMAFDLGYKQNSGSKLAPYFLALQSEALSQLGQRQKAIDTLGMAIDKMSKKDDFYGIYKAKLGLLKTDSADAKVQKDGLEILKSLSDIDKSGPDTSGKFTSLYYLGLYYWNKGEIKTAKEYWTKLVALDEESQKKDVSGMPQRSTQYVNLAKEKLDQFS